MENMERSKFYDFMSLISEQQIYRNALIQASFLYNTKSANIDGLNPYKIIEFYEKIVNKWYKHKQHKQQNGWFQNQLRIFIWLLVNYLYVHKKKIQNLIAQDWQFFSDVFNNKNILHLEFQSLFLLKLKTTQSKWETQQINLLQKILNSKIQKNKWNSIARDLYMFSNKKYYKTPKQCRQRWLNYLDPQKTKQTWSLHEDVVLLQTVLSTGKRWSVIVKFLQNTRTQHNVKNRFKAIMTNEKKLMGQNNWIDEIQILKETINRFKFQLKQKIAEQNKYEQLIELKLVYLNNIQSIKKQIKPHNQLKCKTNIQSQKYQQLNQFLMISQECLQFQIQYHIKKEQFYKGNSSNANRTDASQMQNQKFFYNQTLNNSLELQQKRQEDSSYNYSQIQQQIELFLN